MTAVEFLVNALLLNETTSIYNEWAIEQAKEMEQDQNEIWWSKGWNDGYNCRQEEELEEQENI